jgi:hypothetical protein
MTMPLPPDGYSIGQTPLRGTRPKEVEISFCLWIANFVLGVVGVIIAYSQISQVRAETVDRVLAQNPAVDQSMVGRVTTAAFVVALVVGLLIVATELVFAFLMRGGRNWARIVLVVLGGLAVLFGLMGVVATAGARSVTGALHLLLLIGAIVTMFLPPANAWFRSHRPGF